MASLVEASISSQKLNKQQQRNPQDRSFINYTAATRRVERRLRRVSVAGTTKRKMSKVQYRRQNGTVIFLRNRRQLLQTDRRERSFCREEKIIFFFF
jgi:hypothetical protein